MHSKVVGAAIGLWLGAVHAGVVTTGGTATAGNGLMSSIGSACSVDFNGGNAANLCGATYTGAGPSNFAIGTTGAHATPVGDSTPYLSIGRTDGSRVVIDLVTPRDYFGFYYGSLDTYNEVRFLLNGALVDEFSGDQLNALAFPGLPTDGRQDQATYINYFADSVGGSRRFFNQISMSSSQDAFETDNHAFALVSSSARLQPTAVSTPGTAVLAAIGLMIVGLVVWRHRRRDARRPSGPRPGGTPRDGMQGHDGLSSGAGFGLLVINR